MLLLRLLYNQFEHVICSQRTNRLNMAKNNPPGDGHRVGAIKQRSQTLTPSGHYVKRDTDTGRFLDVKATDKTPFKGVRREKK